MPYATQNDMVELFGEREVLLLSNLDNEDDITTINETRLAASLEYASDKIDLYVCGLYPWIKNEPPSQLRSLCCDLARYHLEHNEPLRDDVVKRAEAAQSLLEKILEGTLLLVPASAESGHEEAIAIIAQPRVFTSDVLDSY